MGNNAPGSHVHHPRISQVQTVRQVINSGRPANMSGLRYIATKAQALRDRGPSAPNPRLVSLTQGFFLRGEQQEATEYKGVILEPDDAPEPRPEFDSFDKVPRTWRPLWSVLGLLLVGVVGFATWRSFHLLSRPGSTIQAASRAMVSAQRQDPAYPVPPTSTTTGPPTQPAAPAQQGATAQPAAPAARSAEMAQPLVPTERPAPSAPSQQPLTIVPSPPPAAAETAAPVSTAPATATSEPTPPAPTPAATASVPAAPATPPSAVPLTPAASPPAAAAPEPTTTSSEPVTPAAAAATEQAQAPSRMPGDGKGTGSDKPKLRSRPLRGYVWSPATNGLVPADSVPESSPASGAVADPSSGSEPSTGAPATSPAPFDSTPKPTIPAAPIIE